MAYGRPAVVITILLPTNNISFVSQLLSCTHGFYCYYKHWNAFAIGIARTVCPALLKTEKVCNVLAQGPIGVFTTVNTTFSRHLTATESITGAPRLSVDPRVPPGDRRPNGRGL
jgi:hypothetical protein